ncbi:hypothetical protein [Enterovirga sp. CN4-39]|uniref:hypothetical protein n=1 Tax=Enterovirga sp. CN4-39 TaxID=3400910 RepID=UPI003C0C7D4D
MPLDELTYAKRSDVLGGGGLVQENAWGTRSTRPIVRSSVWRFYLRDNDGQWVDLPERYTGALIGAKQRCFELSTSLGASVNADQVQTTVPASISNPLVASGGKHDDDHASRHRQEGSLEPARLIERAEYAI